MNTSLFPKSLYTTRLMILGLAYFGYRLIDTTECMVVEDCSNADAANSSQPVSPPRKTHSNIVPADAFDEPFTSEDLAKAELDESVETNRLGFFDRLFGAEPSGAVVMATSIEPGGFSDANVLHMLEDIIWLLIRDDKIALRLTTLIKNRFCESDTNVGDNSAPSITAVESLNKDVPPVTIPPSEQIERIAHAEKPSSNLRKSGVQETEAALSPTATDGTKPATEGDTCNSRSFTTVSPGRFYRFISRLGTPISAVAYVYTRSVVGYLIKTNTAQFVFNGIVSFLVRFLYGANGNTGEVKGPMSVIVPDESCFQEKLSRLNTFYLNNTDLYLRTIGGYIFYGALPDSLDIVHATPPFETVTCVSTSNEFVYLVMDVDGEMAVCSFAPPPLVSDVDMNSEFNLSNMYFPTVGDHVLGVIISKNFDFYTLDIGGLCEAILPTVDGFRGATKRNRPNLMEGDVVFCQVTREYPRRELHTEVSCLNVDDMKQWTTKETYFGHLENGFLFTVPVPYSYCLSSKRCYVLDKCAQRFKYEIAIGLNGRVWVRGANEKETLWIARYIRMCFGLTVPQMEALFTYLDSK